MAKSYLEITYRHGKPFAAYLYLPRLANDRSARTERRGPLLIDYSADGRAIGMEFTSFTGIDAATVNHVLRDLDQETVAPTDLAPLTAA